MNHLDTVYLLVGHFNPEFTSYFAAHGITYYIIKDIKRHSSKDEHSTVVDFSDKPALYRAIEALVPQPTCVFTMYEQYIPITAEINQHLGFRHALSTDAARVATDKILMRQALARAPRPISPAFSLVETEEQAAAFAEEHGFPLMLKPANLSKSLLVSRCDSLPELRQAFQNAMAEAPALYDTFTDGLAPRFILEEYMPGSVHTVLSFADARGEVVLANEIVDNVTAKEAGFDDSFIFSRTIPSQLDAASQREVLDCTKLGMQAMGLRSCAAHAELIYTEDGPRIIEIGARVGGYRVRMYQHASGIDVIGAALAAYRGELPEITAKKQEHYRVIELFPARKGAFVAVPGFDEAGALPSVVSARLKPTPGTPLGKASGGYKAAAIFELHHAQEAQVQKDYDFIRQRVRIEVA